MDLVLLFKALKRKFWVLFFIPFITAVISFFATIDSPKLYKSDAQLSTGYTMIDPVVFNQRISPYESGVMFNNLIASLTSTKVISLLSYRLILHDLTKKKPFREIPFEENGKTTYVDKYSSTLIFQQKLDSMQLLSSFDDVEVELLSLLDNYGYSYNKLLSQLNIFREGFTDYVTISFVSENPELSAFVVNVLCEEFFRYSGSLRLERASESVKALARIVDQKHKDLNEKEKTLRNFKKNQGVYNFQFESENKMNLISELEKSLEDEKRDLRGLKLQLSLINKQLGYSNTDQNNGNTSNEKILILRENINKLNNEYIQNNNPAIREKISELRIQLQEEITKIKGNMDSGLELSDRKILLKNKSDLELKIAIAEENIYSISKRLGSIKRDANYYASTEAEISSLERDFQLANQEYLEAQNKYNDAINKTSALDTQIKQIIYGQPAVFPEPSKRKVITLMSAAASFVLCFFFIILYEYLDLSIKIPSNFQKQVDIHLMGILSIGATRINQRDYTNSQDIHLEQLRKVRYEIESSGKKIILFTSLRKDAGKTEIIKSLSQIFQLNGKKVLLIDTNFSNNQLTKDFHAPKSLEAIVKHTNHYLTTLNRNEYSKSSTLMLSPTLISGVDIIGNSGGNYSPSEVLPYDNFKEIIYFLKKQYDFIFLESASLNKYTDTKELIPFIEGIICVFSAKDPVKNADRQSIKYLKALESKLIGSILNKVDSNNIES
ncbi:exopolysaccharide transport family protein [Chondrinema litorale]|uniref:exopolysaccharide transport family protein n=1 Tax=Chondrinema litorale TaxID=2994555 RepID=UPI002542C6B5|nr:hypothetical protein [Chondrinema litorale]UZS00141.1 hypothetical protein OQ292_39985 [Chondrinema litorale]